MTKLLDFRHLRQVYLVCGKTDLRKGIDGLATIVQEQFELDPFSPALFLFCGTRKDRFKAIFWEGDGFVLLYKRYESGHLQWPPKSHRSPPVNSSTAGMAVNRFSD